MDAKTLGKYIHDARKRKGYTQERLAKEIGISTMSIRRYETGERTISDALLLKITEVLNLPPNYFDFRDPIDEAVIYALRVFCADDPRSEKIAINAARYVEYSYKKEGYSFSENEHQLVVAFSKLTASGQQEAVKRVEELTEIPRYQRHDPLEPADATSAKEPPQDT